MYANNNKLYIIRKKKTRGPFEGCGCVDSLEIFKYKQWRLEKIRLNEIVTKGSWIAEQFATWSCILLQKIKIRSRVQYISRR